MHETEFLIVGAGIIGLTLARELLKNGFRVLVIEKEPMVGVHASGRNSGVLHAGIYYPSNTLKAKLCLSGNLLLQEYCLKHSLPLKKTGKVIVAKNETELQQLDILYKRASENGATVRLISEQELSTIEPNAKTYQQALHSLDTAIIDSQSILSHILKENMTNERFKLLYSCQFKHCDSPSEVYTSLGKIRYQYLINCAGAYADKIAHIFGVGKNYTLLPFKGIYYKIKANTPFYMNGNIYPVPNLKNPFLGVHFTKNIKNTIYVGPTATPAFGRENYAWLQGINTELPKILQQQIRLLVHSKPFRSLASQEIKKYLRSNFFKEAKQLVKDIDIGWLEKTTKVGIRPQLIDIRKKELVMDFTFIKNDNNLHILNAISPAFTSSIAFSQYLVTEVLKI